MPYDPSKPYTVESAAPKYDPTKPYTVESAAPKYDPTKPYTVESAAPEVAQNVPAEVPTRPSITSLLDQAGRDNRTITTPDASSAFVPAPDTKPTTVTQDNPVAHDDPIARAFRTVVKPDFTIEQSTEAAVKLLDQDRDGFEPAEYMKANPGANPLFAKIVLEVYKARSREGLIATRVLTKAPEVAFGYGAEGYGMLGSIASGIKGQFKNWAKVESPFPLPEGERELAAKKIFAATMLASGGLVDQARTGIRKIGENRVFTGIVPRAINWAVTPGAEAKDIILGYGGPSTDAGWQARLNSDVKMLHRMEAAATGQNLPGGPFTAEQTAEVKDMQAADPFTLGLTAGVGKAVGLVGKGVALADAASTLRRVASASLTAEQRIAQTLAAKAISAAPKLTAAEIAAEIAADTSAKATAAAKAADVAATEAGTGPLVPRVSALLNTPVVKSTLTAGALTGLSEKDEQAAAMAGLGAAGVAVSGLSTGIKRNLPIVVESANAIGGAANLADKASVVVPNLINRIPPVAGPVIGAGLGGLGGGAIGAGLGALAGPLIRKGITAAADHAGSVFKRGAEAVADVATITEQKLKQTAGVLEGDQGIYRLPSDEVIKMASKVSPDLGKQVAQEFKFNKDATLKAISADPLAIQLVDPKMIDAMSFEKPVVLNRTLEVVAKSPLEQLLGLDPLKSTKKSRKVSAAEKKIQAAVDRQAGPLKQPPGAFMPLTTEVLPDGTGAVVGFGKSLIDATVRKVFDTPDLKAEFMREGRLTADGKRLNQLGADYLLKRFDEANALQLEDIGPKESPTRVFKSAKGLLTNIKEEIDAKKAAKADANARVTALKNKQKMQDLGHESRSRAHAQTDLELRIKLDKAAGALEANKSVRDPLSPKATADRLIIEQAIEGLNSEKAKLVQDIKAEVDSKSAADGINREGIKNATQELLQAEADRDALNARAAAYGDLNMIDRLGILDAVPERVPLSKIQSTTRLPGSNGNPIGNKLYRDVIEQFAKDRVTAKRDRAAALVAASESRRAAAEISRAAADRSRAATGTP